MAKKPKTKPRTKSSATRSSAKADQIDPRKKLLARIAGNVAAAIVQSPSPATTSSDKIADIAVDIAEQILRKVGLDASSADPSSVAPGEVAA